MSVRPPFTPGPLLREFPRDTWENVRQEESTVRLLLARHGGFRERIKGLLKSTEDALNGEQSPPDFCYELATELHYFIPLLEGHHQAESARLYPRLIKHFPKTKLKFDTLEEDHHRLDRAIDSLGKMPEFLMTHAPTLEAFIKTCGSFRTELKTFQLLLNRHLDDEEDLVIPILLKLNLSLDL